MACGGSCDRAHGGDNDDNKRQQEESEDSSAEEAASLCVSCGPDADFKDEIDRIKLEQDLTYPFRRRCSEVGCARCLLGHFCLRRWSETKEWKDRVAAVEKTADAVRVERRDNGQATASVCVMGRGLEFPLTGCRTLQG